MKNVWEKLTSYGGLQENYLLAVVCKLLSRVTHPHGSGRLLKSYENLRKLLTNGRMVTAAEALLSVGFR